MRKLTYVPTTVGKLPVTTVSAFQFSASTVPEPSSTSGSSTTSQAEGYRRKSTVPSTVSSTGTSAASATSLNRAAKAVGLSLKAITLTSGQESARSVYHVPIVTVEGNSKENTGALLSP